MKNTSDLFVKKKSVATYRVIVSMLWIVFFSIIILIPSISELVDKAILLERTHPGYLRLSNIANHINASGEVNRINLDDSQYRKIISVNKDGFGDVLPEDLKLYFKYLSISEPEVQELSIIFDDKTGIIISKDDSVATYYGVVDDRGNVSDIISEIDINEPIQKQVDGITRIITEWRKKENNKIEYEIRVDIEGNRITNSDGISVYEREYDNKHRPVCITTYDLDGYPINNAEGFSQKKRIYSGSNQEAFEYYYAGNRLLHMGSGYFHNFLQSLQNDKYIVFMSVYDDAENGLTDGLVKDMYNLGITIDLRHKIRHSYYAVISPNKVVEDISEEPLLVSGDIEGINYRIISTGGNINTISSIVLNGVEYSQNKRGLNIVVYDCLKSTVVDSLVFDACDPLITVYP